MFEFYYKTKDWISEYIRYHQPSTQQKKLLGLYTDSYDLDFVARKLASEESAVYLSENMRQAKNFRRDYDLQAWLGSQVDYLLLQQGLVLEFGVASGRTLNHFGRIFKDYTVYGFDSFDGLPEGWTWYIDQGSFRQSTLPKVRSNCQLVTGLFSSTVADFISVYNKPVAFVHVDCDLYSSTRDALVPLVDNICNGTIILFDEYFNYPGWKHDEYCAWQEIVAEYKIEYEYIGMVTRHQQVAVRVTNIGEKKSKKVKNLG